ncbi:MAG: hypothetical protein ABI919_08815, partial [Ramlibacter sp.]
MEGNRRQGDQLARFAALITRLAGEHDAVLSHEGAYVNDDKLSLATASPASVTLAAHAQGVYAELGRKLGAD